MGEDALPAFEAVLEEHGRAVLRFCVAQAGAGRGEDVFQETMLAALRSYERVRDPKAVRAWLFQIAARKAVDAHRERAREPLPTADTEPLAVAAGAVADDVEASALVDPGLWERVRALPDKQRQAIALRYLGDLSHREIAAAMEISEPAARRNVFEGLRGLRAALAGSPISRS